MLSINMTFTCLETLLLKLKLKHKKPVKTEIKLEGLVSYILYSYENP